MSEKTVIRDWTGERTITAHKAGAGGGAHVIINTAPDSTYCDGRWGKWGLQLTPEATRELIEALEPHADPEEVWPTFDEEGPATEKDRPESRTPADEALETLLEIAGDTSIQPSQRIEAARAVLHADRS